MSLMTAELWAKIGEVLISWGGPGIVIIWLLEERRRLQKKVDGLQVKLEDALKSKLDQAKEFWLILRDNEKSYSALSASINAILTHGMGRGKRD